MFFFLNLFHRLKLIQWCSKESKKISFSNVSVSMLNTMPTTFTISLRWTIGRLLNIYIQRPLAYIEVLMLGIAVALYSCVADFNPLLQNSIKIYC